MNDEPQKPHRITLADQLARQHELLMAAATKQARERTDHTEYGTVGTSGDRFGLAYLKSLVVVREDGEDSVAYSGRKQAALLAELDFLVSVNADKLRRELEASVSKPKAVK